jgi:hypothetical protein
MDFYLVFTKNRKRFDKYIKVNKIKNKVIIDIKFLLDDYDVDDYETYREYFNLIIYTRIKHSMDKNKDIYYIPNFNNKDFDIEEVFKIKKILSNNEINFNILIFYDEFKDDDYINQSILENMNLFDASQILKSY